MYQCIRSLLLFRVLYCCFKQPWLNTLRLRQNCHRFADDILKCIFRNEDVWIPFKISLKFVPKVRLNNILALLQIMAWRQPGDRLFSDAMMVSLLTHMRHSVSVCFKKQNNTKTHLSSLNRRPGNICDSDSLQMSSDTLRLYREMPSKIGRKYIHCPEHDVKRCIMRLFVCAYVYAQLYWPNIISLICLCYLCWLFIYTIKWFLISNIVLWLKDCSKLINIAGLWQFEAGSWKFLF